jgi:hypothetical protein
LFRSFDIPELMLPSRIFLKRVDAHREATDANVLGDKVAVII